MMSRHESDSQKAESLEQMRRRVDEVLLGERSLKASHSFFKSFMRIAGQTYDTLIYEHVKKVPHAASLARASRSLNVARGIGRLVRGI